MRPKKEKNANIDFLQEACQFLFETDFNASLRCTGESLRFVTKELKNFILGNRFCCLFFLRRGLSLRQNNNSDSRKPFEVKNEFLTI